MPPSLLGGSVMSGGGTTGTGKNSGCSGSGGSSFTVLNNNSSHGNGSNAASSTSSYATSTLLREISMLRSRLKDLEDDNKSSVFGGSESGNNSGTNSMGMSSLEISIAQQRGEEMLNVLRKELAKVEHEKANLEREFMNQMSSLATENRNVVSGLQDKLVRAEALNHDLTERLRKRQDQDEGTQQIIEQMVEEERERHAKEMEQMKATLASSDMEIAENRRDMDHLHAQLDEALVEKDYLEQHVIEIEGLYSHEKRETQSLCDQLKASDSARSKLQWDLQQKEKQIEKEKLEAGHLNDTIIQLQNHKDMLLAEVTDLKVELNKKKQQLPGSVNRASSTPSTPSEIDKAAAAAEHQKLLDSCRLLETRIASFQEKLGERDRTIDNLADSLKEERRASKALKGEIKILKQRSPPSKGDASSNKPPSPPDVPVQAQAPKSPPNVTRIPMSSTSSVVVDGKQPRTPVSGMVAKFERGMSTNKALPVATTTSSSSTPIAIATAADEIMHEDHPSMHLLRQELEKEREVVLELQGMLRQEKSTIRQLRKELDDAAASEKTKTDHLQSQLTEKEDVVVRLTSQIQEDSRKITTLEEKLQLEEGVSCKLRDELVESQRTEVKGSVGMSELLQQEQELVKDLRKELSESAARHDSDKEAIADLQEKLQHELELVKSVRAELTDALGKGGDELKLKLDESQREVDRLRTKIQGFEAEKLGSKEKSRKSQSELSKLRMKAHQAQAEKKDLETKFTATNREMERLRNELSYKMDGCSIQDEKKEYEREDEEVLRLRDQVAALQPELAAALDEIEKLQAEINRLKKALHMEQLACVEAQTKALELQNNANDDHTAAAVATLSKHHSQKSYDARINKLQVELTKVQLAKDEMQKDYEKRLQEMEDELQALEIEADQELEQKENELNDYRYKLAEQETTITRLQMEQSQICHSMNDVSTSRQDDIEELQTELIAMNSKTSAQAREIQSLKMKIEEFETKKLDSVDKYERKIRVLEDEILSLKGGAQSEAGKLDVEDIKSENSRLREAIRNVQSERRALKDRLESLLSDKSASKSAQVLRDRNTALKEEVEKLTKRVKKMEASITRFAI